MNTKFKLFLSIIMLTSVLAISACSDKDTCTEKIWYQDSDGDEFGNPNISEKSCQQPAGYVADNTDFNDVDASSYPGAPEVCSDGIDNDGDTFTDCTDSDCSSSCEICDDGVDNDGDGFIDCEDTDCSADIAC